MSKRRSLGEAKQEFLDYYLPLLPQFTSKSELEAYLTRRSPPVLLVSPYHESDLKDLWSRQNISWQPLDWFPFAVFWPSGIPFGTSLPGFSSGWLYSLNPSSLLPVLALNPQPADSLLDASAAPGGKTLAIANFLYPHLSTLFANDVSLPRFKRLRTVLKNFGYSSVITSHSPIQALKYKLNCQFTKILLDAPCSSEKHVFNSKQHLKIWSPKHIANLCHLQGLLLDALLPLLAPDGTLVYSTCALAPAENDGVISQFLLHHPEFHQLPLNIQTARSRLADADPMFVAALSRQN